MHAPPTNLNMLQYTLKEFV